jgi:hypothetical protein
MGDVGQRCELYTEAGQCDAMFDEGTENMQSRVSLKKANYIRVTAKLVLNAPAAFWNSGLLPPEFIETGTKTPAFMRPAFNLDQAFTGSFSDMYPG